MACIPSTAHTYYDCTVPRIQPKYMLSISSLHHWTSVFRFKILWSLYPSLSTIYLSFIFLNPRTQRSLCIPASELPCEAKCRWPEALHKFTLLTFPALSSAALQRALGAAWSGNFAATVGMPPHFSLWGCVVLERSIDKGKDRGPAKDLKELGDATANARDLSGFLPLPRCKSLGSLGRKSKVLSHRNNLRDH